LNLVREGKPYESSAPVVRHSSRSSRWFHEECEEEEEIGEGGFGTIKKANCGGRTLALKRQKTNYASLNELSILSTYSHETIIGIELKTMSIFGIDLYLEYGTVLSELTPPPRSWWEAYFEEQFEIQHKNYILDVCNGVRYLHSHGIIHRDLKPENIIIINGRAKIADFGLSIQGIIRDDDNTRKLAEVVSLPYKSPELLSHTMRYSFEIDVWSLACVILEMITGTIAFPGRWEGEVRESQEKVLSLPNPLGCISDEVARNVLLDMLEPKQTRISSDEAYSRFLVHF
jgi:cell division cycle 2-like protein